MTELSLWEALRRPFPPQELEWREQHGTVLCYITARAVMERLDDLLPGAWSDDYEHVVISRRQGVTDKGQPCSNKKAHHFEDVETHGLKCHLTLHVAGGAITRSDVGVVTDIADLKGAASDAFKRAAVKFGIGRYLYYIEARRYEDLPAWAKWGGMGRHKLAIEAAEKLRQSVALPEAAPVSQASLAHDGVLEEEPQPQAQAQPAAQTFEPDQGSQPKEAFQPGAPAGTYPDPDETLYADAVKAMPPPEPFKPAVLQKVIERGPESWCPSGGDPELAVVVRGRKLADAIFDTKLRQYLHVYAADKNADEGERTRRKALVDWISALSKSPHLHTF